MNLSCWLKLIWVNCCEKLCLYLWFRELLGSFAIRSKFTVLDAFKFCLIFTSAVLEFFNKFAGFYGLYSVSKTFTVVLNPRFLLGWLLIGVVSLELLNFISRIERLLSLSDVSNVISLMYFSNCLPLRTIFCMLSSVGLPLYCR